MKALFAIACDLISANRDFRRLFFLKMLGLENNIYAQVSMVMLIGLLGKNAVLIVEFAVQQHRSGKTVFQAAIAGAAVRLRPILMTSLPSCRINTLVLATGPVQLETELLGLRLRGMLSEPYRSSPHSGLYFILQAFLQGTILLKMRRNL